MTPDDGFVAKKNQTRKLGAQAWFSGIASAILWCLIPVFRLIFESPVREYSLAIITAIAVLMTCLCRIMIVEAKIVTLEERIDALEREKKEQA